MDARQGVSIGAATAPLGTIISGPLDLWLVAATHLQPPWRDAETFVRAYHVVQIVPYLAGLLLVGGFVMLLTSLHLLAAEELRVRTVWALGFVSAFAAMIFTNYTVQTTVVPGLVEQWSPGDGPLLSALTMANPRSLGWALEMWGYGVLGVATWLCAPVFARGTLERVIALLFRERLFHYRGCPIPPRDSYVLITYITPYAVMPTLLSSHKARFWTAALAGGTVVGATLGVRRLVGDRKAHHIERQLFATPVGLPLFTPDLADDLPEPARRYLLHAIAPGTPLAPSVYLRMDGTMTPQPGGSPVSLTAEETLAPLRGFVWTARAHMGGLRLRVRDHYFEQDGGVRVTLLGLVPLPSDSGPDVARSSRGRLVAEAVWCPTALIGPDVTWEAVDADRARFTLSVDGEAIPVAVHIGPDGALRAVTLERWGDVGVSSFRPLPYGFAVEEEAAFEGVTIPVRLRGGWGYGTPRYDPVTAATFIVRAAVFAARPITGLLGPNIRDGLPAALRNLRPEAATQPARVTR